MGSGSKSTTLTQAVQVSENDLSTGSLHNVEQLSSPHLTPGKTVHFKDSKTASWTAIDLDALPPRPRQGTPYQTSAPTTPAASAPNSRRTSTSDVARDEIELLGQQENAASLDRPQNQMQGRPAVFASTAAEIFFICVCAAAQLVVQSNYGQGMALMLDLQKGLALDDNQLAWIVSAFSLSNGSFVIVFGSLADRIGGRRVFLGGALWLVLWTTVCGAAPSGGVFILARAMQGIAGGALLPAAISILGNVYEPGRRKNRAFSAFGSMAPVGFIVGVSQSGTITKFASWRVNFYFAAVMYVAYAAAVYFFIPSDDKLQARALGPLRQAMRGFDWLGSASAVAGLVLLAFGLTDGPNKSWAPYTYSMIIIGLLLLVIFVMVEAYVAANPIMPLEIWKTPSFAPLMVASVFGWGGFACWQWIAALFWLKIKESPPLLLAGYFMPNLIFGVLATFACATLLHILPGHVIFAVSCLCFGGGPAAMLPLTWDSGRSYFYTGLLSVSISTLGPDLAFASASVFITSSVKRKYAGTAGSLVNTVFNVSMSIGTGIGGIVEAQVMAAQLSKDPSMSLEQATLISYRATWWFCLALALISFVITVVFVRIPKTDEKKHIE
ncbi:hypothetical protein PYCC9005_000417 [Savitreella phatthalungensis]